MASDSWLSDLYVMHRRLLLLVAWNVTGDRDVAEDVLQSAMVRLALLNTSPVNAKAFALKTVRNMAIDHLRAAKRRRESALTSEVATFSTIGQVTDDAVKTDIQQALNQLEKEDIETVRLHLQGQLTFREIGELLDQPLQTVASRYRRAINKLRAMVEAQHDTR